MLYCRQGKMSNNTIKYNNRTQHKPGEKNKPFDDVAIACNKNEKMK
jgi:hypothetical protein